MLSDLYVLRQPLLHPLIGKVAPLHGITQLPSHVLYNSQAMPPHPSSLLFSPHPTLCVNCSAESRIARARIVVCSLPFSRSASPRCPKATDNFACRDAPLLLLVVLTCSPQTGRLRCPPQSRQSYSEVATHQLGGLKDLHNHS